MKFIDGYWMNAAPYTIHYIGSAYSLIQLLQLPVPCEYRIGQRVPGQLRLIDAAAHTPRSPRIQ